MALLKTLKQGQIYAETWVLRPKLGAIFPENRVIKATRFGQKLMPFVAVFAVVWQQFFAKGNDIAFAAAILTALFALALPLQGLYWLGKRSEKSLSEPSAVSFQQVLWLLAQQGVTIQPIENPTYQDLANVLKKADQHLPAEFWNDI